MNGNSLPRVRMNWKIRPLRQFAPLGPRGVVFSNASLLLAVYYYNVALGEEMYCKLHPNWLGSIDSVEFNVTLSLWKRNDYHCAAEQQL